MTRRLALPLVALALLVAFVSFGLQRAGPELAHDAPATAAPAPESWSQVAAQARGFLDTYVEDGRVVRTDQGGDTVSEGQAYAMLLAVAVGDEATFRSVWAWTQQHLRRADGLLSWRWADGAVADAESASDADLDAARALVVGGRVFGDPALAADGVRLGGAILDHETVDSPYGRVLVAGSWATRAPYAFNPSYVSPAAFWLLAKRSGDPRWTELDEGSSAAVAATSSGLPPDWAVVGDGARPDDGPSGAPVQFGYDAARTYVRFAESCDGGDRRYVRDTGGALDDDGTARATYDLDGEPRSSYGSPVASTSQAAVLAVEGHRSPAYGALADARASAEQDPTYYGDAWAALGPVLLATDKLGGCPVLALSR
jgi:endoglucanase